MATTTKRTNKTAEPAQSTDPMASALLNIAKMLEKVDTRLTKLETSPAPVAAEPTAEVKRGRGRPKGSKNAASESATVSNALPMPKITLTRSEAEHLATTHWRRFADENKNYRRSLRSAIKLCEDGDFDTLAEMFAARGVGKVNSQTGKGMPHYVAEAISHLTADLKG